MFSHDGTIKDTPDKASPTSYIAPLRQIALVSYLPLQYSYAVSVGNINEIRGQDEWFFSVVGKQVCLCLCGNNHDSFLHLLIFLYCYRKSGCCFSNKKTDLQIPFGRCKQSFIFIESLSR